MAITDRSAIKPGVKLVAKYKGQTYRCEVVQSAVPSDEGKLLYRLTMGGKTTDHKSPSSAGSQIFGIDKDGKPRTCNGWGFWTLDGEPENATPAPTPPTRKRKAKETPAQPAAQDPAAAGDVYSPETVYECADCHVSFPTTMELSEHFNQAHSQPSDEASQPAEGELVTA